MINVMQSLERVRNSLENNIDEATLTTFMHLGSSVKDFYSSGDNEFGRIYSFTHLHQGKVYFAIPRGCFRTVKSNSDIVKTGFYRDMVANFETVPYTLIVCATSDPAVLVRTPNGVIRPRHVFEGDIVRITPTYLAFNPEVAARLKEFPKRLGLHNLETAIQQDEFLQEIMGIHSRYMHDR